MNPNKPWQISPATPLQKCYSPTAPDVEMVNVTLLDDRLDKSDDGYERTVQVRRGALPRAALAALTGSKGHAAIKQLDFALIDGGRCRLALWKALGIEAESDAGVPLKKSAPEPKLSAHDRMLAAARSLDHLVDEITKGRK